IFKTYGQKLQFSTEKATNFYEFQEKFGPKTLNIAKIWLRSAKNFNFPSKMMKISSNRRTQKGLKSFKSRKTGYWVTDFERKSNFSR
uniref:Ribosomal protein L32 n=1 Tax=Romanomermis culicivorax TaxID=13658 RepID=A0A915J1J1_ROMCU